MGITLGMRPYVGTKDGVHYSYGYSGHGIAATHTAAKTLRDLVLGRDLSEIGHELTTAERETQSPPEPLMFAGSRATTALLQVQDTAMDRGMSRPDIDFLSAALKLATRMGKTAPARRG